MYVCMCISDMRNWQNWLSLLLMFGAWLERSESPWPMVFVVLQLAAIRENRR